MESWGWFHSTVILKSAGLLAVTNEAKCRFGMLLITLITSVKLQEMQLHAGIGSDFDGGFGLQSVPPEIDTIADLQKLVSLLQARGYNDTDIENIFSGNWIARLKRDLPA